MIFALLFSLSQMRKSIYICIKHCHPLCPANSLIIKSSFLDIQNYLLSNLKKDEEIEFNFYSKQDKFSIEMDSAIFNNTQAILKTVYDSQPIKLKIKTDSQPVYKTYLIKNDPQFIFPYQLELLKQEPNISINKEYQPTSEKFYFNTNTHTYYSNIRQFQSKEKTNLLENEPSSSSSLIPISVPISMMTITGEIGCHTYYHCENETYFPSLCGFSCWTNGTDNHSFEYTFKGERFGIYGTKDPLHGIFDVYLNDVKIAEANEKNESRYKNQLIYLSDILDYNEYTIKASGTEVFEIYKFVYWPSMNSKRINSTQMESTKTWIIQSDTIGGIGELTNEEGATKSISLYGYKFLLYGAVDPSFGHMIISFNGHNFDVSAQNETRGENVLLWESEFVPFSLYDFKITAKDSIFITCIYSILDPQLQNPTPLPSMTPIPDKDDSFIDKYYEKLDDQIFIQPDSNISQISGCTFYNISLYRNYIFRIQKDILFFSNTFQYLDLENNYPMPLWLDYNGKLTVSDCKFINCMHRRDKPRVDDGNVLNTHPNYITDATFEYCEFINCGNVASWPIFRVDNQNSKIKISHCSFSFDNSSSASRILSSNTENVKINDCKFNKCGTVQLDDKYNNNSNLNNPEDNFEYTNNNVYYFSQMILNINTLTIKPNISGNNFFCNNLDKTYYLISIRHKLDLLELTNNKFVENRTPEGCYGGAFWFEKINKTEYTLVFDNCQFIKNENTNTESPYNYGGAIHYGYDTSIANTAINFNDCTFEENKCENGKGGALAFSINQSITINNCIFKNNYASQGSAIYFLGQLHSQIDTEQISSESQIDLFSITRCQFIGNKGDGDVTGILIEEDIVKIKDLIISSCNFSDNGNSDNQVLIQSTSNNVIFEDNKIEYEKTEHTNGALKMIYRGDFILHKSTFHGCMYRDESSIQLTGNSDSNLTITNCELIDCKASKYSVMITNGELLINNCLFKFTDIENSCSGINIDSFDSILIENCQFEKNNNQNEGETGCLYIHRNDTPISSLYLDNIIFNSCTGKTYNTIYVDASCQQISTISNITIYNSQNTQEEVYILGFNVDQDLSFEKCTFRNCRSNNAQGGGIGSRLISSNKISFRECTWTNNYCSKNGGSFEYGGESQYNDKVIEIKNCNFMNNKSEQSGGALYIHTNTNVLIDECKFINNVARFSDSSNLLTNEEESGGALAIQTIKNCNINNCLFENNHAKVSGGAIFIDPDFQNELVTQERNPSIDLSACKFFDNTADKNGCALFVTGLNAIYTISDIEFYENGVRESIFYSNASLINFDHSSFTMISNGAIEFSSTANITIQSISFENCNTRNSYCPVIKISLSTTTEELSEYRIENCTFKNCESHDKGVSVFANNIETLDISNCIFNDCRGNGAVAYIGTEVKMLEFHSNEVINMNDPNNFMIVSGAETFSLDQEDIIMTNCNIKGIQLIGGDSLLFQNLTIEGLKTVFSIEEDVKKVEIYDCNFINCPTNNDFVILINNNLCKFINNKIFFDNDLKGRAISITGQGDIQVTHNKFINCKPNRDSESSIVFNPNKIESIPGIILFNYNLIQGISIYKLAIFNINFINENFNFDHNVIKECINNRLADGYFSQVYNIQYKFIITNLTFKDCISGARYGGSFGCWFVSNKHNNNQTISFINCSFINNSHIYGSGGGVFQIGTSSNSQFAINIEGCIFSSNSERQNGGTLSIGDFRNTYKNLPITIFDSVFSNNTALEGFGGAIYLKNNNIENIKIDNCIFENNYDSHGDGNAIYIEFTGENEIKNSVEITNCYFYNNMTGKNDIEHNYAINTLSPVFSISNSTFVTDKIENKMSAIKIIGQNTLNSVINVTFEVCQAFDIESKSSKTEIINSSFRNCNLLNEKNGNAIYIDSITDQVNIDSSLFENCGTNGGFAVYSSTPYLKFTDNIVTHSIDDENTWGGGIYIDNDSFENNEGGNTNECLIQNSIFKNNKAVQGGALYIKITISWIVENCTFENNKATSVNEGGGAIFVDTNLNDSFAGNSQITKSKFNNNVVSSIKGTMIYITESNEIHESNSIIIDGSNIMNNIGEEGYLICNGFDNLILENIRFSYDGTADKEFGVLYCISDGVTIINNCTFDKTGFTKLRSLGNSIRIDSNSTVKINSCEFIDCISSTKNNYFVIYGNVHGQIFEMTNSIINFSSTDNSLSGICIEKYSTFTIDSCNFINCHQNKNIKYAGAIHYGPYSHKDDINFHHLCKLTIINCTFDNCNNLDNEKYGRVINCFIAQPPILSNCTIKNTVNGSYIFSIVNNGDSDTLKLDNFMFINNQAYCNEGGTGISILNVQNPIFMNCSFIDNSQMNNECNGGAYSCQFLPKDSFKEILFEQCFFEDNSNSENGGALYIRAPDFKVTINECIFSETRNINEKGVSNLGGSLYISKENEGGVDIEKCIFKNNQAKTDGNAIVIEQKGSLVAINDCVFDECHYNNEHSVILSYGENILKFINNTIAFTDQSKSSNGITINMPSDIIIKNSSFINCICNSYGCGFSYNPNSQIINSFNENIIIENATFDNCISKYFNNDKNTAFYIFINQQFTFTKVTIKNINIPTNQNLIIIETSSFIEEQKIDECTFINCSTNCNENNNGGLSFKYNNIYHLIFTFCKFINLRTSEFGGALSINDETNKERNCSVDFTNCIFDNDLANGNKGGGIYINSNIECNIDNCSFINNLVSNEIKYGNAISIDKSDKINIIDTKFIDCGQASHGNVIKFSGTKITIQNNTIKFNQENNGCRGIDISTSSDIEIINSIFTRCVCEESGGGLYLHINLINDNNETMIILENLTFDFCTAKSGGGIQINEEIHNNDIEVKNCTFKHNKSNFNGGALLIQNVNKISINNCIFNGNIANKQYSSSQLLSDKLKGNGGAIFISSEYDIVKTNETEILIEGCIFTNNNGYDGNGIYIEGYGYGSEFIIRHNNFTNNFCIENEDNDPYFLHRAVITSEVFNLYDGKVLTENLIINIGTEQTTKLSYVGLNGIPILATKTSDFSMSFYFSKSNEFSKSEIFTKTNTFKQSHSQSPVIFTTKTKRIIYSNSISLTYILKKSISYSISYYLSNTYSIIFISEENTYVMISSETNFYGYFPYIIYYLSPSYVPTFISMINTKKKSISQEQLIGITCGSASVFFLVLGIIILAIRRMNENKQVFDEFDDLSYSFEEHDTRKSTIIKETQIDEDNDDFSNDEITTNIYYTESCSEIFL